MNHRARILALIAATLTACSSGAQGVTGSPSPSPAGSPQATASPTECVQSTLVALSATQKAGQLIFLGLAANRLGPAERTAIVTFGAGSVWFTEVSSAPATSLAGVSAEVQALAPATTNGIGFLVAANQEGGRIDALYGPGFDVIPSALQQGSEDPAVLQAAAATWAAQLASAGINLDLAPVMDTVPLGHDTSNAPIGALQREFGHDPGTVSTHGLAFIAGMHQSHVLVTIKHFPGLGRVEGNTDFSSAVVDRVTTATDPYLAPFQAAIDEGADLVMVSTATYTNLDRQHLAVFSPVVMRLLRGQMHFSGVVVSDDLGAAVAVASVPAGARAVDFIAAGGNLVTVKNAALVSPMVGAITQHMAADPVFAGQVDASVKLVLELKVRAGLLRCGA